MSVINVIEMIRWYCRLTSYHNSFRFDVDYEVYFNIMYECIICITYIRSFILGYNEAIQTGFKHACESVRS